MLDADLPDLSLDLSELEMPSLDMDLDLDALAAPAPESAEASQPAAEAENIPEPAPAPEESEEKAAEAETKQETGFGRASKDWCASAAAPKSAAGSAFSLDYRAVALRNASMLDMDVPPGESDDASDAFEGVPGGAGAIEIRPATLEDVPDIIDLAAAMVKYSMSPFRPVAEDKLAESRRKDMQSIHKLINTDNFGAFVARDDRGRMIGHVLVNIGMVDFLTGEEQAWIFDIAVTPKKWGSGISRRLLQEAERFARERGIRHMGLTVTVSNARALRFYQRSGYQEERYQMLKNLNPINLESIGGLEDYEGGEA